MIKFNAPRPLRLFRDRQRGHFNSCIEQLEHALSGRHRRLQDVVLLAQILNRTEKPLRVLHERDQHAERRHAPDHIIPPEPDNAGDGNRRQYFDHRVIHRVRHDGVFKRLHVRSIDVGKFIEGALLAIEKLQPSIPETASCKYALIRAIAVRIRRYESRTLSRKILVAYTISGSIAKVMSASFQFIFIMIAIMPASTKTSSKMETTPAVNISFSASTSVVTRVTSRPTGFLSKNATCMCCRCRKIWLRRSNITFCPVHCIR